MEKIPSNLCLYPIPTSAKPRNAFSEKYFWKQTVECSQWLGFSTANQSGSFLAPTGSWFSPLCLSHSHLIRHLFLIAIYWSFSSVVTVIAKLLSQRDNNSLIIRHSEFVCINNIMELVPVQKLFFHFYYVWHPATWPAVIRHYHHDVIVNASRAGDVAT